MSRTLINPDDTFETYAARLAFEERAHAEEARRARIAGAKTNLEWLLAAGVASYDDGYGEMTRAFRAEKLADEVKRTGKPASVIEADWQAETDRDNARAELQNIWQMGETMAEWRARVTAAQIVAKGTKENGRPCNHVTTKKDRGWINRSGCYTMIATDEAGNYPFKCCRCGVEVDVPKRTLPSEQAVLAAKLLAELAKLIELARAS